MLSNDLRKLIEKIQNSQCETQNIEVKKAEKGTPERIYDTLSSFSNQIGGGVIIFGLDEKNNYKVTGVYDVQNLQIQITNYALQMEPPVRPIFTVLEMNGKHIVSAEIPECETSLKPCFYKAAGRVRGSYVRVGESDLPMSEYEVYSYEAYKKKIRDELRVIDRAELSAFSKELKDEYFQKVSSEKPLLAKHNKNSILNLQGLTDNNKPTVAGLMLIGDYPQRFFPQMSITAMVVNGKEIGRNGINGDRFVDSKRFDGTIIQMLEESMKFIKRNIKTAIIIDNNGERHDKPEYPLIAVREIILNALIHRDYSIYTEDSPIRIILFSDRIEVSNPGGLYGRQTIDELGKKPGDTRNPYIASNLEIMLSTENRFSGIPTVIEEMRVAGLKPPVFEDKRGNFKVTLYNEKNNFEEQTKIVVSDNIEDKILDFCSIPRTREEITKYLNVNSAYYVISKYIKPLIKSKKLIMTIPEKPGSKYQKYFSSKS